MRRIKPVLYALAASALGAVCLACGSGGGSSTASGGAPVPVASGTAAAGHGAGTMCQPYQATDVADGAYTIQDDEWDSKAAQCVSTKGDAAFTVTKSELANPADGNPGSYPSIYAGCNWGACTQGGLAAQPQQLGNLSPGDVTTTLATTQP